MKDFYLLTFYPSLENATNLRSCFYPPNSTIDGCSALAEAYIEIIGLLGEILGAQESPESIDALANEIQRLSLECESLLTSQAGYEGRSKLDSDRFWILCVSTNTVICT